MWADLWCHKPPRPLVPQATAVRDLLAELRWRADMDVVNDFGEHVWLRPVLATVDDVWHEVCAAHGVADWRSGYLLDFGYKSRGRVVEVGEQVAITDCCPVDAPCAHHAPMQPRGRHDQIIHVEHGTRTDTN